MLRAQFCDAACVLCVCTPAIAIRTVSLWEWQAVHRTRRTCLLFATCSSVSHFLWPFTHPCVCRAHAHVLQSFSRRLLAYVPTINQSASRVQVHRIHVPLFM
jgi:hypothetical protein